MHMNGDAWPKARQESEVLEEHVAVRTDNVRRIDEQDVAFAELIEEAWRHIFDFAAQDLDTGFSSQGIS